LCSGLLRRPLTGQISSTGVRRGGFGVAFFLQITQGGVVFLERCRLNLQLCPSRPRRRRRSGDGLEMSVVVVITRPSNFMPLTISRPTILPPIRPTADHAALHFSNP